MTDKTGKKIAIIGAGAVGAAAAYTLAHSGTCPQDTAL